MKFGVIFPNAYYISGLRLLADIDECANASLNNCTANQACNNLIGGFDCLCGPGYMATPPGSTNCIGKRMHLSPTLQFHYHARLHYTINKWWLIILQQLCSSSTYCAITHILLFALANFVLIIYIISLLPSIRFKAQFLNTLVGLFFPESVFVIMCIKPQNLNSE